MKKCKAKAVYGLTAVSVKEKVHVAGDKTIKKKIKKTSKLLSFFKKI